MLLVEFGTNGIQKLVEFKKSYDFVCLIRGLNLQGMLFTMQTHLDRKVAQSMFVKRALSIWLVTSPIGAVALRVRRLPRVL